jgi:large subunit ribosomal protein L1
VGGHRGRLHHKGDIMAEAKKKVASSKKQAVSKDKDTKAVKKAELVTETVPVEAAPEAKLEIKQETPEPKAKAGKRSAKAVKETEEKQTKEARKTNEPAAKAKPAVKAARSRAERAGKKYREAAKLIDADKNYSLAEALELASKTNPAKFDASIELHINLNVDPKQADHNIRDTVVLPAGTGKTIRIAVLADDEGSAKAKKAGADHADADKLFAMLDKETLDFDVLIAQPPMMAKLGKYARLLGPRGLMPNPKSGTVTANVETAVSEAKAGRVEYRVDQSGIIHLAVGKASFKPESLNLNAQAVIASIRAAKPASLKGIYIKSIHTSSSMGPSIKIDTSGL